MGVPDRAWSGLVWAGRHLDTDWNLDLDMGLVLSVYQMVVCPTKINDPVRASTRRRKGRGFSFPGPKEIDSSTSIVYVEGAIMDSLLFTWNGNLG